MTREERQVLWAMAVYVALDAFPKIVSLVERFLPEVK